MAPQMPMACARSRRSLKVLEMIDRVVGKITAAPTPMTRRAAMRPPVVPAAAPPPRTPPPQRLRGPFARPLAVVGGWGRLLTRRAALRGAPLLGASPGTRGLPRRFLPARLDRLVEAGIFIRRQYSDHPPRSE